MFPFGALPENLTSFCAFLRRDYGFHIGAGELLDAARAIDIVDLSSKRTVRSALRSVLACTRDDVVAFDAAFDRFFISRSSSENAAFTLKRGLEADSPEQGDSEEAARLRREPQASASDSEDSTAEGIGPLTPFETSEEHRDKNAPAATWGASYSPVGVENGTGPDVEEADEAWTAAARVLVRRLQLGPSRKWRAAVRGRRFDVRRTLRASLQTGSEPLSPKWLTKPRRQPRFVVLVDGSRSMSQHAGTALRLAAALARASSRVEVFTFSTALERVTTDLKRATLDKKHRLRTLASAWGGGTTIGACLTQFLRRFGDRLLSRSTVIIVASDGLDVGEPETLRAAMQALRRRSSALVWLNPLLDTPGYEATALGMRVAKPFITTFSSVNDLAGFVRLSRSLRVRS